MSSKIINKILSGLFLIDYVIVMFLLFSILYVGSPITDYYTGTNLFFFISKITLHFILGLAAIVVLFFNITKAIYIVIPLYVLEIFLFKYWRISPDSPKIQKIIETAQQALETGEIIHIDVKAIVYPYSFVYGFYILCIIYIFLVMPKLKKDN